MLQSFFTNFRTKLERLEERLEKFVRDKHSSLLWKFVNYWQKKFKTLGQGRKKKATLN
jgi:hypothetical protein